MSTLNTGILEDLNAHYFATVKEALLTDQQAALVALGINKEIADIILALTPNEILAICKSGLPQFRIFISAENLRQAAKASAPQSQKAWMYLSRETSHAHP